MHCKDNANNIHARNTTTMAFHETERYVSEMNDNKIALQIAGFHFISIIEMS